MMVSKIPTDTGILTLQKRKMFHARVLNEANALSGCFASCNEMEMETSRGLEVDNQEPRVLNTIYAHVCSCQFQSHISRQYNIHICMH